MDIDQRLQRQLSAIEAGVDALLVGDRIRALKTERQQVELAIAHLDDDRHARTGLDLDDACAVLDALPNLHDALAAADPEAPPPGLRRPASGSRSTETRPRYD